MRWRGGAGIWLLVSALFVACGDRPSQAASPAVPTLTPGLPSNGFPIKSAGKVLTISPADERVTIQIERGNQGAQAVWDDAIVLIRPAERLVFTWTALGTPPPGVSATKLSELRAGERISFVLHPDSWNSADRSFAVSLIGRAAP